MQSQTVISPETCFERTRAGQCEMLTKRVALSPVDRRLLAIVNGYTPLGSLLALIGETEVPQATISTLLDAGLIRVTPSKPKTANVLRFATGSSRVEWFNGL
jgi:hypothetical protein